MAAKTIKLKYPIVVVNTDRTERKTFMTRAVLEEVMTKAYRFGCHGDILLHDEDGSEICDDEILEYLLHRKAIFMICNKCSDWMQQKDTEIPVEKEKKDVTQILAPKVITKLSSDARNLNLITNKKIASETSLVLNSPVILADDFEGSRIFRNGEDCSYPEFANFVIPWEKIPLDILELLETEQRLQRKANTLANLLIDELRLLKLTIPIPIMRRVAERVVSRFPRSFLAHDTHKNSTELSEAFLAVLKNRYFNILRGFIKTNKGTKRTRKPAVSTVKHEIYVSPQHDPDTDVKIEYDSLSSFE